MWVLRGALLRLWLEIDESSNLFVGWHGPFALLRSVAELDDEKVKEADEEQEEEWVDKEQQLQ